MIGGHEKQIGSELPETVEVEERKLKKLEEGGNKREKTAVEKMKEVEDALHDSEGRIFGVVGSSKDREKDFVNRVVKNLNTPPEVAENILHDEQIKGNFDGVQRRDDIVKKHGSLLKGIALAVGLGAPGVAEGIIPGMAEAGLENIAVGQIRSASELKNPVLEEAKRKMTPETRKAAMQIGMNFPGQEQKKEIKFVRVGANESESSSAMELTRRLEVEDSPKDSQDRGADEGDIVESGNDEDGNDEDSGVRVSPDVQFVGGKTPEKKHKTQKELDEEMLYRLTEEEKNQSIPSAESPSMLDSVVDAVKGAGLQAATALGKKSESSRHMFKPPTEKLDEMKGNDGIEVPVYRKPIPTKKGKATFGVDVSISRKPGIGFSIEYEK